MRLHCEQCNHGYDPRATHCPWCGCSSQMAHTDHTDSMFDTECVIDYWLCSFDTGEVFQLCEGTPLDIDGLRRTLSRYTCVSFNGNKYDMPLIAVALSGADNKTLKWANDQLIVHKVRHWDLLRSIGVQPLDWVDHIDMIEVAPGQASLKMYMAKMHSRKLQDLPFDPDARFKWYDRAFARWYCGNDLRGTRELYDTFPEQLQLRRDMSNEYGIDLRSKSDAQIAEAVMKSILPFEVVRPNIQCGSSFNYSPPEWLHIADSNLIARVANSSFYINEDGGIAPAYDNHLVDWGDKSKRLDIHGRWVTRPDGWKHELITIGDMQYAMGIGGLHSTETKILHTACKVYRLISPDVAAYYPSLIVRLRIAPVQIGEAFVVTYADWKYRRDRAKIAKDKKKANSLKTLNNGTFGKLNDKYSIFRAPAELIQVTLTGQLALIMLIKVLVACGIQVISANTDGIVVKCPRALDWLYRECITWWEGVTQFTMEDTEFEILACRDVNNFIGITTTGDVKLKGAFAPPDPGASGWPNPTGQICTDAVVAYLQHGIMLADTIRACTDIRQFIYVRQVKGGGSYCPNGTLPRRTTLSAMRVAIQAAGGLPSPLKAVLTADYDKLCDRVAEDREYLGKAVRWYYAAGSRGCIVTPAGGLVARTDGCRPMMELTDTVPDDLDYEWYIREAESLLMDIGVNG